MLENIKLFATNTDRSTYEDSEDYVEPYVSLVETDNGVHYNKGGNTPTKTLEDGNYKYDITGEGEAFAVFQTQSGRVEVWVSGLTEGSGINAYDSSGNYMGFSGNLSIISGITAIAETYNNFISCDRKVVTGSRISDWGNYKTLEPAE